MTESIQEFEKLANSSIKLGAMNAILDVTVWLGNYPVKTSEEKDMLIHLLHYLKKLKDKSSKA